MKKNKYTYLFIFSTLCLLTISGCAKIETTPLEERLPLFDWSSMHVHTVYGIEDNTGLSEVVTDYYTYEHRSLYYNCLFEFTGNDVKFYEIRLFGFENDTLLIDAGTWTLQSDKISFNESFRSSFNEYFGFSPETGYYETVSYRGILHLGSKYYDPERGTQNYKILELGVRN